MLLDNFIDGKPVIVYDSRESRTFVVRYINKFKDVIGVKRPLEIADYLIQTEGKTIAVERKRASDFLSSFSDGRLFTQAEHLLEYDDPRIILEGAIFTSTKSGRCYSIDTLGKSLNTKRKSRTQPRTMWSTGFFIHPHAFTSTFKKIQDLGITIIPTGSAYDTADLLRYWATRKNRKEYLSIRRKTKVFSDFDKQLFLISGLSGISTKRAEALLKKFGTPMRVFNSFLEFSPKKFPLDGVGKKTASDIKILLTKSHVNSKPSRLIEYEFKESIDGLNRILLEKEIQLKKMKVPEIRSLLKVKKIALSGNKDKLINRYLNNISEDEKVDIALFTRKYEELFKIKTDFQNIPENLKDTYERFKTSQPPEGKNI